MSDKFNEKAARALNYSLTLAREFGHTYIGSEHLLLSLVSIQDSSAAKLLESKGYPYKKVREALILLAGVGIRTHLSPEQMTPRLKKIIERAAKLAGETQATSIGTEHLLFAILEEKEGMAARILSQLDVNVGEIKGELWSHITSGKRIKGKRFYSSPTDIPTLSAFGKDITALAADGKLDPVIGRDKETDRLIQVLLRRTKNNPCLIGEPGVGKTAIIEGVAQRIVNNDIPALLQGRIIYTLDLTSMIAGAKYRGEFEDRLKGVMSELKRYPKIILFIDELHTIVGAGSAEGAIDAANILKPALSRGEIRVIGATTLQEYRKHIERDAALERRFQPILIEEPNEDSAYQILLGLKELYEAHHGVQISDDAIRAAVALSVRYIPDRFLPDKALDVLDETCARVKSTHFSNDNPRQDTEHSIFALRKGKEEALSNLDFATASYYRDEELRLQSALATTILEGGEEPTKLLLDQCPIITPSDIQYTIQEQTRIPILGKEITANNANLGTLLQKQIIGQDKAIDTIVRAIRRNEIGIRDPKRPIGCFLFVGPTGVGKTALCKALSAELYGGDTAFIQLNMSEYQESHSISKLIGSPPGYVGFEEGGQLTERVRRQPYSLVVFDEIEKAHPDIYNILLQILDEGILQDAQGRNISFKNTMVVLTSNIGTQHATHAKMLGFAHPASTPSQIDAERILEQVRATFRPELINRLDEIVIFDPIDKATATEITSLLLDRLAKRLAQIGITLTFDRTVIEHITNLAFDPRYGARAISRTITREVEDKLADLLSKCLYKRPLIANLSIANADIHFDIQENT